VLGVPVLARQVVVAKVVDVLGARLVGDLREHGQAEAGQLNLAPQPTDVVPLVEAAVAPFAAQAAAQEVMLTVDVPRDLPPVQADRDRVRQVLLNLLANALRHTPPEGVISVEVQAQPQQMLIRVRDTGSGIALEDLPRIWERFYRVDNSNTRRIGGTGLGLAITRALVNDMGGQVQVASEFGRGTRFRVELPLPLVQPVVQPAAACAPQQAPAMARYPGPARRVLVVDDVAENRALLCDFLVKAGFEVAQAADGGELLAAAKGFRPDLILLDSLMPAVDGMEATRRLRRDPQLQAVPVIAISASATAEHRAECLNAGVNVFLAKPVSLQALQAHILEQLGLR